MHVSAHLSGKLGAVRRVLVLVIAAVVFASPARALAQQSDTGAAIDNWPLYAPNVQPCGLTSTTTGTGTGTLPTIIPEPYNGAFTQGGNNHKVSPALVAAIFTEENFTHSPTSQLASIWANFPKVHPNPNGGWPTSSAGASGPFQFLPSTWTGLGYNIADINNLATAADAAAKYLASNGATTDKPPSSWQNAIFAYNHAQWYVDAVMTYYNFYSSGKTSTVPPPTATTTASPCGGASATVNCSGAQPAGTQGLTAVRQNAVCVANEELSRWKSGKMHAGFRTCNDFTLSSTCDSFAKYSHNADQLWCADFVSWVYHVAGYPIGSGTGWPIPAVLSISQIGQAGGRWHYHAAGSYTPVPGDLAIHATSQHVNMVVAVSGKTITLVGGDEVGPNFPDGSVVSIDTYTSDITGYVSPN